MISHHSNDNTERLKHCQELYLGIFVIYLHFTFFIFEEVGLKYILIDFRKVSFEFFLEFFACFIIIFIKKEDDHVYTV